jgi:hypothetical protein
VNLFASLDGGKPGSISCLTVYHQKWLKLLAINIEST